MKVAFYIGDHAGDAPIVRLGCWATRLVQKGPFGIVTHCEAIHAEYEDGSVMIASASLRDGGVRSKRCKLNKDNWWIVDVPSWDIYHSVAWFDEQNGLPYDWRGAWATVMPGNHRENQWFCNEAVGASIGLIHPWTFGPHHFAAIALTLGEDVTNHFFGVRQ